MDAEFRRKNDAQFDHAKGWLNDVGYHFIYFMAEDFTEKTRGFENQREGAIYIPTGRLRGGLNWTRAPIERTSKGLTAGRREQGPFSDYGKETMLRIAEQLKGKSLGGVSYLENDVAYGWLIVTGSGPHEGFQYDWPKMSQRSQDAAARRALQAARR